MITEAKGSLADFNSLDSFCPICTDLLNDLAAAMSAYEDCKTRLISITVYSKAAEYRKQRDEMYDRQLDVQLARHSLESHGFQHHPMGLRKLRA